ncbi:hypothetical protein HYD42_00945 [Mycoplasmopsis bovis]|nr:hypothetical protein [Mycoplasmopsis bovis]QQH84174.1 hypothetical protein HYD42_00945 [Mycoplasmopsis bovis]
MHKDVEWIRINGMKRRSDWKNKSKEFENWSSSQELENYLSSYDKEDFINEFELEEKLEKTKNKRKKKKKNKKKHEIGNSKGWKTNSMRINKKTKRKLFKN